MNSMRTFLLTAASGFVLAAGCDAPDEPTRYFEVELGPIELTLDDVDTTVWPGVETEDGRHVRRINGFFQGEPSAYWFAGFASRLSPDVFWFCPEDVDACPFDEDGVVDRTVTVGEPVFSVIPGAPNYSPFWLAWRVNVPDGYQANDLKSVAGIQRAANDGYLSVEPVIFDHGADHGPDLTVQHCLITLHDTALEFNGEDLVSQPGVPAKYIPPQAGWHKQYSLQFYDYTMSEGVVPPDPASESVPMFRAADIFVFFRDCEGGSESLVCEYAATTGEFGAVGERGIEEDLTFDGDKADTNNIISGFPGVVNTDPLDKAYSPLWRVMQVRIPVEHDDDIQLIFETGDQNETMIKTLDTMRELIDEGLLLEPRTISEDTAGLPIPGNDGVMFFNCPSQVPE